VPLTGDGAQNADVRGDQSDQRDDEHGKQTEYGVELFLPAFCVKFIGDALVEWFSERAFHHGEYGQLLDSIERSNVSTCYRAECYGICS
jgi:hypothetical protein